MVYKTQNYWILDLKRTNLSHWTVAEVSLSKVPNKVSVSHPPEDGNRTSFRNVLFSSF
jgi:hypothetical protein